MNEDPLMGQEPEALAYALTINGMQSHACVPSFSIDSLHSFVAAVPLPPADLEIFTQYVQALDTKLRAFEAARTPYFKPDGKRNFFHLGDLNVTK
ncbi:hypothetical protein GGR53DRAFT_467444 [Hypoxylon sp. FL1150]|nr:hypothetical protein GGR53DRAFT_467444 [Hypoxylon sp. FL1150]